jgi:hypothetical protein
LTPELLPENVKSHDQMIEAVLMSVCNGVPAFSISLSTLSIKVLHLDFVGSWLSLEGKTMVDEDFWLRGREQLPRSTIELMEGHTDTGVFVSLGSEVHEMPVHDLVGPVVGISRCFTIHEARCRKYPELRRHGERELRIGFPESLDHEVGEYGPQWQGVGR